MIILKTPSEIEKMRASNLVVLEVLETLRENVSPGVTTMDLEKIAEAETAKRGAVPAFKGYRGFPYCLCISVDDEVVHGMPSATRVLNEGSIVSLDFGVLLDGYFGDSAVTLPVGNVSPEAAKLIEVASTSLDRAIGAASIGNRLMDIAFAVQDYVEGEGFSIVRDFVGHGIGRELHEPPQVPNFGKPGRGIRLKEGMVLAIEPMISMGRKEVKVLEDGWTAVTEDGSLSAHFEHSVAITSEGPYVLSRSG